MVAEESSPDVWGVLTDGVRWRVLRRKGSTVDCVGVVELELPGDPDAVAELRDLIGYRVSAARMTRSPVTAPRRLLEALAGTAEDALEALGVEGAGRIPTADNAERKAFKEDYVVTAWGEGPVYAQEQQSLGEPRVAVGVVQVRAPLNREAVQNAMRALARQSPARAAVAAFARRDGDDLKACFATHLDGRTSVGERFDPDCPNAYAAANAAAVEKALAKPELNWKAIKRSRVQPQAPRRVLRRRAALDRQADGWPQAGRTQGSASPPAAVRVRVGHEGASGRSERLVRSVVVGPRGRRVVSPRRGALSVPQAAEPSGNQSAAASRSGDPRGHAGGALPERQPVRRTGGRRLRVERQRLLRPRGVRRRRVVDDLRARRVDHPGGKTRRQGNRPSTPRCSVCCSSS